MIRPIVYSLIVLSLVCIVTARTVRADAASDRSALAQAVTKLAEHATSIARAASRSEDRAMRKRFASRAAELSDDLTALARRTRKDVAYDVLAKATLEIGGDASALVDLADEAEDAGERRALRAQAASLEQGIVMTRKVMQALARASDKPARPASMRASAFDQLVRAIRSASFDDDKVAVVRHAAQTNWFLATQIAAVMDLLSFDDGKIDAAAAMWSHLVDPENSFTIFDKLSFDSSKEKLRKRVSR